MAPDWDIGAMEMCEKTFLMVILDPFQDLEDKNREDNVVMIPIERDCNSFAMMEPLCHVTPDFSVLGNTFVDHCYSSFLCKCFFLGRNALFMNDESLMMGQGFSFYGASGRVAQVPLSSMTGMVSNIMSHYVNVYYSEMKENCQTIPKLWEMYMERKSNILTVRNIKYIFERALF